MLAHQRVAELKTRFDSQLSRMTILWLVCHLRLDPSAEQHEPRVPRPVKSGQMRVHGDDVTKGRPSGFFDRAVRGDVSHP